jgi:hypothetical protein
VLQTLPNPQVALTCANRFTRAYEMHVRPRDGLVCLMAVDLSAAERRVPAHQWPFRSKKRSRSCFSEPLIRARCSTKLTVETFDQVALSKWKRLVST